MSKKNKIILLVAMVLVLAIAAYVNIYLLTRGEQGGDDNLVETGNFFTKARTDRQATRNYELQVLNEIIATQGEEYAQARANAMDQKQKLIEITEAELLIETMLKAQGFEDVIVQMATSSNYITIIVADDDLTKEERTKIYSIVSTHVTTSPDYIRILAI
jgi:hypothetical protein